MSKHLASQWLSVAKQLALVRSPHARANNIAMALADAYRQGYGDSRKEEVEDDASAAILLRTLAAEAERTGSWHVPVDMQERIAAWLKMREAGGAR